MANPTFEEFFPDDAVTVAGDGSIVIQPINLGVDPIPVFQDPRMFIKAFLEYTRKSLSLTPSPSSRVRVTRQDAVATGVLTTTFTVAIQSQLSLSTAVLNES